MNANFLQHLDQLELLAFFSGYPLLYAFVLSIFANKYLGKIKIISLLPYAYALTATFYLGLQLKNLYPDYSFDNIRSLFHPLILRMLALLAIFFWLPLLNRKPILSLLHSLIFFFLLVKDLFLSLFKNQQNKGIIQNDMKVFTDSLLVNAASFITVIIICYLFYSLKLKSKRA